MMSCECDVWMFMALKVSYQSKYALHRSEVLVRLNNSITQSCDEVKDEYLMI